MEANTLLAWNIQVRRGPVSLTCFFFFFFFFKFNNNKNNIEDILRFNNYNSRYIYISLPIRWDIVSKYYSRQNILFIDGADDHPAAMYRWVPRLIAKAYICDFSLSISKFGRKGTVFRREDARFTTDYKSAVC